MALTVLCKFSSQRLFTKNLKVFVAWHYSGSLCVMMLWWLRRSLLDTETSYIPSTSGER